MTRLPDDQIDPYEPRLARRVDAFAEQAVRPFDATAVTAAARAGARRQSFAARLFGSAGATARLGIVLAGALVGALALGVYIGAGGPGQTQTSNGPEATPTDVPGAAEPCTADALSGLITGWDGAAGHRIATIVITNGGPAACLLPDLLRPALIDGDGHALIVGEAVTGRASLTFGAGASVTSEVDMANYCGVAPTPADKPLKLRMYLPDQSSVELPSAASLPLAADPPPCNGAGVPASIQMQPLQPAARY